MYEQDLAGLPEPYQSTARAACATLDTLRQEASFGQLRELLGERADDGLGEPAARLAETLRLAATSVPYYKYLQPSLPPNPVLADFPIMLKQELRGNFPDLLVAVDEQGTMPTGRMIVARTGGSTGTPTATMKCAESDGFADAVMNERMFRQYGVPDTGSIIDVGIYYEGRPIVTAVAYARLYLSWNLRWHDPRNAEVMAEYDAVMPHIDPVAILGSSHRLVRLAQYCAEHDLRLRPTAVFAGWEHLNPGDREFLSETFDCPVVVMYGTAEVGAAAWECRERTLHFPADATVIEFVDAARRHGEDEPPKRLLMTGLKSSVMPIIRYDAGDLVGGPADCACGSPEPAITGLEGRSAAFFTGRSGASYPPYRFLRELERLKTVDFQLVNTTDGEVTIVLSEGQALPPGALDELDDRLETVYRVPRGEFTFTVRADGDFTLTRWGKRNPIVVLPR